MASASRPDMGMIGPPRLSLDPLAWIRRNLFGSWFNSVLTIALLLGGATALKPAVRWTVQEAHWQVISVNAVVIVFGRYPADELGRPITALALLILLSLMSWTVWRVDSLARARRWLLWLWVISPVAYALLLRGFSLPTPATVGNNLGYYLFRPEVLPRLGQAWRGGAALALAALVGGLTISITPARWGRWLGLVGLAVLAALNVPLSLQPLTSVAGLPLPRLLVLAPLAALGWLAGSRIGRSLTNLPSRRSYVIGLWLALIPTELLILTAFDVGIPGLDPRSVLNPVEPAIWSGIMLTVVLAVVSIVASFPIGVFLALGRRSQLPVVRGSSILVIEIVRGVPLITVLFMAQVMLPLFLPLDLNIDRVVRAMAGMTIFTAAYLAEVIRGGLQAVRHEQVDAARALGLSEVLVTGLVVLPQALRAVIPAIMGQLVSVFKDTSLVVIVGLLDLVGILQSIIKQRDFVGDVREVYLFAGVFFFIFSYAMSYASRRLEKRLGVGER